jgi:hypothetical protein
MSYVDMAIVGGLFIVIVMMLVAFGMGHKRWSIVSVVATFLVALTIPLYFYYVSLLLAHEWRWAQAARSLETKIARVRDAKEPSADEASGGVLVKIADMASLQELRQARDRWERALTRVDNWRGRHWEKATFTPPQADDQTGSILLPVAAAEPAVDAADPAVDAGEPADAAEPADAPEGDIPASPAGGEAPFDLGATVYVFDDKPLAGGEGGKYLGAFIVQAVATVDGRQELTVQQTAPRDAYDAKVWSQTYDSVSVYTELPNDRWLAFSETRGTPAGEEPAGDDAKVAPPPVKRIEEAIDELVPELDVSGDGLAKRMNFREQVKQHALSANAAPEAIDEGQWPDLRARIASGDILPGEYWAEVTFNERADMEEFLGVDADALGDDPALSIEMDLTSAFEESEANKLTIDKVFYRRPLVDGQTLLHGTALPGNEDRLVSDGLAALRLVLQREIAALEAAKLQLDTGLAKARGELEILDTQKGQFKDDLVKWERDVAEATRLAERFEAEAKAAATRLAEAERMVVELGRQFVGEIRKAVQEVDRAAPTAGRRDAASY